MPLTGITEAVFARTLSSLRDERKAAATTLAGPRAGRRAAYRDDLVDDIRQALYAQQGRGLRAGLRADAGGVAGQRLGPRPRRDGHDLARRLHHPRPVPQPDPRRLRRARRRREPADGALLHRGRRRARRTPGGGWWSPRPSRAWRSRRSPARCPTTTATGASAARPTSSRGCATTSARTPTGGSTATAPSTPGGAGRRRGAHRRVSELDSLTSPTGTTDRAISRAGHHGIADRRCPVDAVSLRRCRMPSPAAWPSSSSPGRRSARRHRGPAERAGRTFRLVDLRRPGGDAFQLSAGASVRVAVNADDASGGHAGSGPSPIALSTASDAPCPELWTARAPRRRRARDCDARRGTLGMRCSSP